MLSDKPLPGPAGGGMNVATAMLLRMTQAQE